MATVPKLRGMRRAAAGTSAPREEAQLVRRRRAGGRKGESEGGTERGRGSGAAAGGAMGAAWDAARPLSPTPCFCSREVRVLALSRGAGCWVGSRAWRQAQVPAPSPPARGCRGRWGTSAAQDRRPGPGRPARGGRDGSVLPQLCESGAARGAGLRLLTVVEAWMRSRVVQRPTANQYPRTSAGNGLHPSLTVKGSV